MFKNMVDAEDSNRKPLVPLCAKASFWMCNAQIVFPQCRWFLTKQRFEQAQKALDRISYWNKTPTVNVMDFQ